MAIYQIPGAAPDVEGSASTAPLVVLFERDDAIAVPLLSQLRLAGYDVRSSRTPVELFDILGKHLTALVLIDLGSATAGRREFWVALDAHRRGRSTQVMTFRNIGPGSLYDTDFESSARALADVDVHGAHEFQLIIESIKQRIPLQGGDPSNAFPPPGGFQPIGAALGVPSPFMQATAAPAPWANGPYSQPQPPAMHNPYGGAQPFGAQNPFAQANSPSSYELNGFQAGFNAPYGQHGYSLPSAPFGSATPPPGSAPFGPPSQFGASGAVAASPFASPSQSNPFLQTADQSPFAQPLTANPFAEMQAGGAKASAAAPVNPFASTDWQGAEADPWGQPSTPTPDPWSQSPGFAAPSQPQSAALGALSASTPGHGYAAGFSAFGGSSSQPSQELHAPAPVSDVWTPPEADLDGETGIVPEMAYKPMDEPRGASRPEWSEQQPTQATPAFPSASEFPPLPRAEWQAEDDLGARETFSRNATAPMPAAASQLPAIRYDNPAEHALGSVLIEGALLSENKLEALKGIQQMLTTVNMEFKLGELALLFKFLSPDQLLAALLVSRGLVSPQQIAGLGRVKQELAGSGMDYDLETLLNMFNILPPEQLNQLRAELA